MEDEIKKKKNKVLSGFKKKVVARHFNSLKKNKRKKSEKQEIRELYFPQVLLWQKILNKK